MILIDLWYALPLQGCQCYLTFDSLHPYRNTSTKQSARHDGSQYGLFRHRRNTYCGGRVWLCRLSFHTFSFTSPILLPGTPIRIPIRSVRATSVIAIASSLRAARPPVQSVECLAEFRHRSLPPVCSVSPHCMVFHPAFEILSYMREVRAATIRATTPNSLQGRAP